MKEIEKNITDGWTIIPPEHAPMARRWIEAAEAVKDPANSSGEASKRPKKKNKELFES